MDQAAVARDTVFLRSTEAVDSALVAYSADQPIDLEGILKSAIGHDPNCFERIYNLAVYCVESRRAEEAIALLQRCQTLPGDHRLIGELLELIRMSLVGWQFADGVCRTTGPADTPSARLRWPG